MRKVLMAMLAGLTVALVACRVEPLAPLDLELTIAATPVQVAAGDSVRFEISARGGVLLRVRVDYGDTEVEEIALVSARTATAVRRHAYARSGVYEVVAIVEDAAQGTKQARATIQVR